MAATNREKSLEGENFTFCSKGVPTHTQSPGTLAISFIERTIDSASKVLPEPGTPEMKITFLSSPEVAFKFSESLIFF